MPTERPPTFPEFVFTCIVAVVFLVIVFALFPPVSPALIVFAIYLLHREYNLMKKGK